MQGASRLRLRGEADPLDERPALRPPTDAELAELGISSDELRRAVFGGYLMWVDLLLSVRDPKAAMMHVAAARRVMDAAHCNERSSYLVARARADSMHRDAIIKQFDWMGYNFGRPNINPDMYYNALPPLRMRRIYSYPGYWSDSRIYGF